MLISSLEKASPADRDAIVALIASVVDHLCQIGIPQWDAEYPNAADVDNDLRKEQLYTVKADGKLAGIMTLNRECDPDYKNGDWLYRGPAFTVVHRLCVSPAMQGQGIASRMMEMAEAMLRASGIQSIRLDAFTQNPHALRLYGKLGYRNAGEAMWRKGRFYLMEKTLQ